MKIRHIATLAVSFLLVACVSAPPALGPMPPVGVVFTTAPKVSQYVGTASLTQATNQALRHYATAAGPSTITVHFTDLANLPEGKDVRWYPDTTTYRRGPVAIISANPSNEVVRQMPETHVTPVSVPVQAVKGTYTITDSNGMVLERKPIYISLEHHDAESVVGEYLAKRAAALTHKQQGQG